jgi:hypothetical protein
MVLRFSAKIFKNHLLHEPFHKIPVFNDAMSDRPLEQESVQLQFIRKSNNFRAQAQNKGLLLVK